MGTLFSHNDVAVLDQSFLARGEIEPENLYLEKIGDRGMVRRARLTANALYIATEDCIHRPDTWQRFSLATSSTQQIIRARVVFPGCQTEWAA